MTTLTLATLSLSILALSIATCALLAARHSSARSLLKQLTALSERLSDLSEAHETMSLQFRNLRSRLNMQAMRSKKANSETPADQDTPRIDPEAEKDRWTREMNLKIATGQVRVR